MEDRQVETLKGSRKIHQVKGSGPYALKVRRLSSFWTKCETANAQQCVNIPYAGKFHHKLLKRSNIDGEGVSCPKGSNIRVLPKENIKVSQSSMDDQFDCSQKENDIQIWQLLQYAVFYIKKPYFGRVVLYLSASLEWKWSSCTIPQRKHQLDLNTLLERLENQAAWKGTFTKKGRNRTSHK